jgi:hypothetical protein
MWNMVYQSRRMTPEGDVLRRRARLFELLFELLWELLFELLHSRASPLPQGELGLHSRARPLPR